MKTILLSICIPVGLLVVVGCLAATARAAETETASYSVVEKGSGFEIRQYEAHVVVTTAMTGKEGNGSFGRLFKYISGSNEASEKIAMTTPVFMPATRDGDPTEMQFVVPASVAVAGAPDPESDAVSLKQMPAGRYAVLRYSGRSNAAKQKGQLANLRALLDQEGLRAVGNPIFAGYNPPWTPGVMRRNEVLLKVQ